MLSYKESENMCGCKPATGGNKSQKSPVLNVGRVEPIGFHEAGSPAGRRPCRAPGARTRGGCHVIGIMVSCSVVG